MTTPETPSEPDVPLSPDTTLSSPTGCRFRDFVVALATPGAKGDQLRNAFENDPQGTGEKRGLTPAQVDALTESDPIEREAKIKAELAAENCGGQYMETPYGLITGI